MAKLNGRALIASRCAKFFKDGDFVNLGIGVPLMCVNYLPDGVDLWLEAEIALSAAARRLNGVMRTLISSMRAECLPPSSKAAAFMNIQPDLV